MGSDGKGKHSPGGVQKGDETRKTSPMNDPQVEDFEAYLRLENLAPITITNYLQQLRYLFRYLDMQGRRPSTIRTAELRRYLASLYQRGLAAGSIEKSVVAIKRFFGFLASEGVLIEDPTADLPYPKVSRGLPKSLTSAEVRTLFSVMEGDSETISRDRIFFELLYTCGLRIGEAVQLRVTDVNWDDGRLRVTGKGNKERRVYLKPYVLTHLQDYVEGQDLTGYLFPGNEGHITTSAMQSRFKSYVREAGLPDDVTPHTLRHSVAVHYLMGGAPISFVQDLLGHESLESTGIYTQLVDEVAREITLNTENALYEGEEKPHGIKEPDHLYTASALGWDEFVSTILPWLGWRSS